jgi:hypothetical protein
MLALAALLLITPAQAEPAVPDPVSTDTLTADDKALFLKCAYVINGYSMNGGPNTVDLSGWQRADLLRCITPAATVLDSTPVATPAAIPTTVPKRRYRYRRHRR